GLDRLHEQEAEQRLADLNGDLARRVEERTAELAKKNILLTAEIEERRWTEEALRDSRAQLQAILDSSPIGIGWSDIDGHVEYINQKFIELFGYTREDIPTVEHWYQLAYPDEKYRNEVVGAWALKVTRAREEGSKPPALESSVVCKGGKIRHVIIAVSWVGKHRLVNFSDISDRWLAEQRDRARNASLEMIAKGTALQEILQGIVRSVEAENQEMICSILLLDRDGRHLRNGASSSLPAFYNQAVDGLEIGDGVGSCGTAAATMRRVVVEDIQSHSYWAKFRELAARAELASCWSEPIISSKGRLLGTFAIYHRQPRQPNEGDLQLIGSAANLAAIAIEHHQTEEELERQAHTDFLTDIANRRYFLELAEAELARTLRYHKPFSLLMFDVDYFKVVNDNYGHKTGDMVLQEIATVFRQTLREVDILGRLGGEEFAAVLPETGADEAREAAERLRLAIAGAEMRTEAEEHLRITVSIGVSALADEQVNIETLLKQADEALYVAKNCGRNQVRMAQGAPPSGSEKILSDFVKLSWHIAYESGHPLIDDQHRALFRKANDLLSAILSGEPADRVAIGVENLFQELFKHFRDEEALFIERGFPGAEKHAIIHRQLEDKATELMHRFSTDNYALGELLHYLAQELIAGHMLKEDREFFPSLKAGTAAGA
ncbi:MAG: diguanylate cyclase, partial [Methylomonas sp.]